MVTRTYTSKIIKARDVSAAPVLVNEIEVFNHMTRCLVNDLQRGGASANGDSWHVAYKKEFHTTDYLVTSVESVAKGAIDSAAECLKAHVEELESQLKQIDNKIKRAEKELKNMTQVKKNLIKRSKAAKAKKKIPEFKSYVGSGISCENGVFIVKRGKRPPLVFETDYLFELNYVDPYICTRKRRINQFKDRKLKKTTLLNAKKEALANKKYSICFGGKKMFKKQFTMPNISHSEWHNSFENARRHGMMLVGRSDGKQGNFMCRYDTQSNVLSVTTGITKAADGKFAKILLSNVVFPYGQEMINMAVSASETNKRNRKLHPEDQEACFPVKPVTWTIFNRGGDFQVACTITLPDVDRHACLLQGGCLGVDMNYDNVAVSDIDAYGNLVGSSVIRFDLEGNSSEKNETILSEVMERVFRAAVVLQKPVVMEDIDHLKKELMYEPATKNRKVSMFAYDIMTDYAERKSYKYGVLLKKVNPAYTSQIGKTKYMKPFGISVHQAASYVIGRRGMGFREQVPKFLFPLIPEAIQGKHTWSQWNYLTRRFKGIPIHNFYKIDANRKYETLDAFLDAIA